MCHELSFDQYRVCGNIKISLSQPCGMYSTLHLIHIACERAFFLNTRLVVIFNSYVIHKFCKILYLRNYMYYITCKFNIRYKKYIWIEQSVHITLTDILYIKTLIIENNLMVNISRHNSLTINSINALWISFLKWNVYVCEQQLCQLNTVNYT